MKYIDISEHQGSVDWDKLAVQHKAGTLGAVMIRAGHGLTPDKFWERNITEANRVRVPVGVYWFSEARTVQEAKSEAQRCLDAIKGRLIECPVCFDFEEWTVNNRLLPYNVNPSRQLITDISCAFLSAIEGAGYWAMNYTNPNCASKYLDASRMARYDLWLASWYTTPDLAHPPQSCGIWQWGGSKIDGITPGVDVDTNEAYKDYPAIMWQNGYNHVKEWAAPSAPVVSTVPAADVRAAYRDCVDYMDKRFSGLLTDD